MSYTLSNDLDLIGKTEDDFGPLISDCLNLGSFADDSPPRGETKAYRRGASPPSYRYGGYRTSPRAAAPSSYQQQPSYYSAPPAQQQGYSNYPGGYHPPPYGGNDQQPPPWASPRPYDYDNARSKEPPYGRATSPPSKKSRRWEGTPEKNKSKSMRSPFRSPMSNPGSAKVRYLLLCRGICTYILLTHMLCCFHRNSRNLRSGAVQVLPVLACTEALE
jgi:hypothetical protein